MGNNVKAKVNDVEVKKEEYIKNLYEEDAKENLNNVRDSFFKMSI